MMGRLHCDIFHQEKFMLNGVDVKIRLFPSKNVFNLMAEVPFANYQSVITHASMFVRKAKINPAVALGQAKASKRAQSSTL